jgi:hypothetical protein
MWYDTVYNLIKKQNGKEIQINVFNTDYNSEEEAENTAHRKLKQTNTVPSCVCVFIQTEFISQSQSE